MISTTSVLIGGTVLLFAAAYWKTSRAGYESAPYTVVKTDGVYEIRDYPTMNIIETKGYASGDKKGNQGFRKLFKFITGQNEKRQNIAMTTPVYM